MESFSEQAQQFQHGRYQHYKGGEYETHFIARHSETGEEMVVYQNIEEREKVWCRPLTMFLESVEINGVRVSRFQKVD